MEKTMSGFPKIKGLRWLCEDFPDLVAIEVTLVDRTLRDLEIEGMAIPEQPGFMYIDLSKLAGVHDWYPKGSDEPSQKCCTVEVDGVDSFIGDISVKDLIEAWIFYKRFYYARK
jgi:hypothetical protein